MGKRAMPKGPPKGRWRGSARMGRGERASPHPRKVPERSRRCSARRHSPGVACTWPWFPGRTGDSRGPGLSGSGALPAGQTRPSTVPRAVQRDPLVPQRRARRPPVAHPLPPHPVCLHCCVTGRDKGEGGSGDRGLAVCVGSSSEPCASHLVPRAVQRDRFPALL